MSRPEDLLPPDLHYSAPTARSYTTSSRIQHIQSLMTERALQLLALTSPSLVLDIGCGTGLSGTILSSPPYSHTWIGLDISEHMLSIARLERDVDGDLLLSDIGQGLGFRPGVFDAVISISCLQWLCNAEGSHESERPERRLKRFFEDLFKCLRRGGRGVFQFYPRDQVQRAMITGAAVKAGFQAGVLEDDGGTKNAKLYLVVMVGGGDVTTVIQGLDDVEVEDARRKREIGGAKGGGGLRGDGKTARKKQREKEQGRIKGSKEWILRKKEQAERKGKVVKKDSRYSGRRRRMAF
ncbi:MAG: hypothetical protein M1828_000159 [Chrysothrix sp. TS-e1954]|nr:MAG: hypothetical protein M1828_000159 [Chrysothrix sp. TS-e1954]